MWVVGHAQVGWFLARATKLERRDRGLVVLCGALPDLDGLSLLFGVTAYYQVHHVWLHNLFACAAFGLLAGALARRRLATLLLGTAAALLHLVSDAMGLLPLVPLWPLSARTFAWDDVNYLLAIFGEIVVPVLLMAWQVRVLRREGKTLLEALAPRWDAALVAWFRRRFPQR